MVGVAAPAKIPRSTPEISDVGYSQKAGNYYAFITKVHPCRLSITNHEGQSGKILAGSFSKLQIENREHGPPSHGPTTTNDDTPLPVRAETTRIRSMPSNTHIVVQ